MSFDPCLMGYGLLAAWLAPRVLGAQTAGGLAPRLAVAAWLAAAVSVLVSWLGAGAALLAHPGVVARSVGAAVLAGLLARLVWVGGRTWWSTRSRRRQHTDAATLLGRPDPVLGVLVLDSPEPAAYCLPGPRGGLVVVTTGAQAALSARELDAVLAHERAHLKERHHLLAAIGQTLTRALPRLRLFGELVGQVVPLLEMRADDAAARRYGARTVATAIAAMGPRTGPAGALGAGGSGVLARANRLCRAGPAGHPRTARLGLVVTAVVLAVGPYLATLPPCPHPW